MIIVDIGGTKIDVYYSFYHYAKIYPKLFFSKLFFLKKFLTKQSFFKLDRIFYEIYNLLNESTFLIALPGKVDVSGNVMLTNIDYHGNFVDDFLGFLTTPDFVLDENKGKKSVFLMNDADAFAYGFATYLNSFRHLMNKDSYIGDNIIFLLNLNVENNKNKASLEKLAFSRLVAGLILGTGLGFGLVVNDVSTGFPMLVQNISGSFGEHPELETAFLNRIKRELESRNLNLVELEHALGHIVNALNQENEEPKFLSAHISKLIDEPLLERHLDMFFKTIHLLYSQYCFDVLAISGGFSRYFFALLKYFIAMKPDYFSSSEKELLSKIVFVDAKLITLGLFAFYHFSFNARS